MPPGAASDCYRFGRFELQPVERRLLATGAPVHIRRRTFDLLMALIESRGNLVTKDELLERVWPKAVVEENALQRQISVLRKVLGPDAIATVAGSGYRFTPEVTYLDATPTGAGPAPKHNLPHQLTSFIGREKEIAEVKQLLSGTRLLTLTGAGGCGKTRLAMEVASELSESYPDGVWLVELAALAEPRLVPQTVANILGRKEKPGETLTESITEYLASRRPLLVLDNAEHLLAACAQLADEVLRRCAQVVIMVTSREPLRMAGELTYRVSSLSVPDLKQEATPEELSAYESARLFIERARLQQPHFAVTAQNAPALASVCYRLDGIPLAIELAAPRVRSMSLEEVNQGLDHRFGLLTGGSRTALPRHQTLRSLIDWSYDLLSGAEQVLLCQVSVFCGGWTLSAARQVCRGEGVSDGEMLDLFTSLVDKSLVLAEEHDGATRYRLLETVRQYARDRLRESNQEARWQSRHLAYFLVLAEEAEPQLIRADQQAWLDRLETEHDNVRSALAWSTAAGGDAAGGLRLAGAFWRFWFVRGYLGEGRGWFTRLLATEPGRQAAAPRAKALNAAGILACQQCDYPAAQALHEEGLAIQRELGDRSGIAGTLNNLGILAYEQGHYSRARELYQESLTMFRELDQQWTVAFSLHNLGGVALYEGDYQSARAFLEESLAITRKVGDPRTIATTMGRLGELASNEGDYASAGRHLDESLAIFRELGDVKGVVASLEGLASLSFKMAAPGRAARIWGAAERLHEEIGSPLAPNEHSCYERQVAAARAAFSDDAAFDLAWQKGRAMSLEQAVRYALDTEKMST